MRGNTAKEKVTEIISSAFGEDYLGTDDKGRLMLSVDDGGELVNICLAMTCPKTVVKKEISSIAEEEVSVDKLLKRLGL